MLLSGAEERRSLISSDLEVVAWQLVVWRRNIEQRKAILAAETPEQREERLAKRRRREEERRARPSQQQRQDAVDDFKALQLSDYTVKFVKLILDN